MLHILKINTRELTAVIKELQCKTQYKEKIAYNEIPGELDNRKKVCFLGRAHSNRSVWFVIQVFPVNFLLSINKWAKKRLNMAVENNLKISESNYNFYARDCLSFFKFARLYCNHHLIAACLSGLAWPNTGLV